MLILVLASFCFSGLSPEEKKYYSSLPNAAYIYYLGEISDEYMSYYEEVKNTITKCDFTREDYDDPEEFEWGMEWCTIVNAKIKSFVFSRNGDLNSKLGEVPNDADYLFIRFADPQAEKIDFTKLKTKKNVGLYTSLGLAKTLSRKEMFRTLLMQHEQFIKLSDKTPASIKRLLKHDQKANKKAKEGYDLKISGSMNGKVGFLTVNGDYGWTVTFVDSKCDCEYLYLAQSVSEGQNSMGIACGILYLISYDFNSRVQYSKLKVKQFSVLTDLSYIDQPKCVVEYGPESLNIYVSGQTDPSLRLPYSYSTESFGFLIRDFTDGLTIDIKKGDGAPAELRGLNLSLLVDIYENNPLEQEEQRPPKVTITQSGWSESDPKPKVVLTYNSENVEVDKSNMNNFDVSVEKPQPPPGPGSQPESNDGLPPAAIAGIVIGCIVVVAAIVAVVVYFVVLRNKGHDSSKEGEK